MRFLHTSCVLGLLLLGVTSGAADLVVIVNPASGVRQMTRAQVVSIYMAHEGQLPSGITALPLDIGTDGRERRDFYQRLLGRSTAEINSYWARLLFSGRASPPRRVDDSAAAVEVVAQNKGAIAYVDKSRVDARVKVVFELAD
jgi:hypothetical protein